MDSAFPPNFQQIMAAIDEAEVITLYCPLLGKALVVDTRRDELEGPFVDLGPMFSSIEERLQSLEKLRPRFPRPEQLLGIPWQRRLAGLRELGVDSRLAQRLAVCGLPDASVVVDHLFEQLTAAEARELQAAIGGQGYRSLWQRGSRHGEPPSRP